MQVVTLLFPTSIHRWQVTITTSVSIAATLRSRSLMVTLKGNVMKTQKGMGLMFDATQMVNLLQKEGKVSNAAAVQAVSNLARSANGARVGFELTK